ncbi:hypothetical protein C8Q78DRAFT_999148 [Trametes maxima]|nr:hypothetical protein C8Q78DRAFT_999148 [Trametes maxima]
MAHTQFTNAPSFYYSPNTHTPKHNKSSGVQTPFLPLTSATPSHFHTHWSNWANNSLHPQTLPLDASDSTGAIHPSWTTLSSEGTTDEETPQHSDSPATTPEPASTNSMVLMAQANPQELPSQQPTAHSMHTSLGGHWGGGRLSPARITKRKLPQTMEGNPTQPQQKKPRSTTHQWPQPTISVTVPNASPGPQTIPRPQHGSISSLKIGTPSAGRVSATPASAPSRPYRQLKAPPLITEESDVREWRRIDKLLNTHVAPSRILPKYARSLLLPQQEGRTQARTLLRVDDFTHRSKGKGRAGYTLTTPRWSNVGEFKERLDAMFGPGDITRGHGRAPKNGKTAIARYSSAGGQTGSTNQADVRSDLDDSIMAAEEGGVEGNIPVYQRGRLEKTSPRKANSHIQA